MNGENIGISIIICTYNRNEFLLKLINSIETFILDHLTVEIIIVNNHPSNIVENLFEDQRLKVPLRIITELNLGLSNARNTGYQASNYNWIVYLDDDCLIDNKFFEELSRTIKDHDFDAFTGNYKPWHYYQPPKWLSSDFEEKYVVATETQSLIFPDYFTGGIMAFKKIVLEEIGPFPEDLGMKGNKIKYGEETIIEKRLRDHNYHIGINPHWMIHHLVRKEKYTVLWQLKSYFAKGRDTYRISKERSLLYLIFQPPYILVKYLVPYLYKLISKKDYYLQNFILDITKPFAINAGKIYGSFLPKIT